MAATGFTPISLYYSATASAVPLAANLVAGELALNTNDGKLYYKNSSNVVTLLAGATSGPAGGSNTQVQFNSSGVLAGSANMTFNGTILTAAGFSGPLNGTVGATTPTTGAFTTLSATGVATFSAGTAALPAITTTGDTNTGIFFPAADTIAFTKGGAEAMRINSSGNVGVGTTTPTNGKFEVSGVSNTVAMAISGAASSTNIGLYVSTDAITGSYRPIVAYTSATTGISLLFENLANVSTADSKVVLAVASGSAGDPKITYTVGGVGGWATGLDNSDSDKFKLSFGDALGTNDYLTVDSSGNVGIGTSSPSFPLTVVTSSSALGIAINGRSSDNFGSMYFYANNGSTQYATITSSATEFRLSSVPAAAVQTFYTNGAERMRIDSSGNVGIGTSSPSYKLDITGSTARVYNDAATLLLQRPTNSRSGSISLTGTTGAIQYYAGTNGAGEASSVAHQFYSDSPSTLSSLMTILGGGNVGIGTTSPSVKFQVNHSSDVAAINASGGGVTLGMSNSSANDVLLRMTNNSSNFYDIRNISSSSNFSLDYNGTSRMTFRASDGVLFVPSVYATTNAAAANVYVGSDGSIVRSTSSLKYKKDVQDATHGLADVLKLRSVTYKGKSESNGDTVFGGFIAEEIDALGLTEFVQYADDGSPDALAYGNMVSLLAKAIQEQQALITSLTARIAALEST